MFQKPANKQSDVSKNKNRLENKEGIERDIDKN